MSESPKLRYRISLDAVGSTDPVRSAAVESLSLPDVDSLAELMMDAYLGTIDYEGESLSEAVDEVEAWFEGSPLLQHSFGAWVDGALVSAIMLSAADGLPFIDYVMTHASGKQQGLGKYVTAIALNSLKEAGEDEVEFYITEGNAASEGLFLSLGAVQQPT